jgi:hypothetical protein
MFAIDYRPPDTVSTIGPGHSFRLNSGQNPKCLPKAKELKSNSQSGCPFCKLVYESLSDFNDETVCLMEWVADGQQDDSASADRRDRYLKGSMSRRIRISWDAQGSSVSDGNPRREEMYFYVPHQTPTRPKQAVTALINSWINQCHKEHDTCKRLYSRPRDTEALNNGAKLPFKDIEDQEADALDRHVGQTSVGFIDVQEMKLAQLPRNNHAKRVKYAALSYV